MLKDLKTVVDNNSLFTVFNNICLENGDLPSSDFAVAKRFINRGGTPVEGKIEPKKTEITKARKSFFTKTR